MTRDLFLVDAVVLHRLSLDGAASADVDNATPLPGPLPQAGEGVFAGLRIVMRHDASPRLQGPPGGRGFHLCQ